MRQPADNHATSHPPGQGGRRVYFAAAITNPARDLLALQGMVQHLQARGHQVPTHHIVEPDPRTRDAALSEAELAQRDLAWLASCEALVAEVTTPSHGVGVEVAWALHRHLPVLVLYRTGTRVSRLLLGLPGVRACAYGNMADATRAIDEFLASLPTTPQGAVS